MTTQVCLRCDWRGTTRGDRCPECQAPLFATPGARDVRRTEARPGSDDPAPEAVEVGGRPRAWIGIGALVLAIVIALVVFQAATVDPEAAGQIQGDEGILVFTERHDDGTATLWSFDLELDELRRGPDVRAPVELVDAYLAAGGWVGVTTQVGGAQRASVYPWFGPESLDTVLAQGTLAGWATGGQSVAAVRSEGSESGRCDVLVVSTAITATQQVAERYRGRTCGDPVAIGRDSRSPFVTLSHEGRVTTYEIATSFEPMEVEEGSFLLGVGRDGELLLGMSESETEDLQGPSFDRLVVTDGTFGGLRSILVGGTPLSPERVLSFSFEGDTAFVLGTDGVDRGIWEVPVDIGSGREPTFVLPARTDDVWATASFDTIAVLVDGAMLVSTSGGPYVDADLPTDAPLVSGPILLVRSLAYSAP